MNTSAARRTPHATTMNSGFANDTGRDRSAISQSRQKETAQYIADMVLELRNLAKSDQLYHVMAPLEIAYYEAYGVAHRVEVPPGEVERLRELARASGDDSQPDHR